jgi:hypothetical protein
VGGVTNSLPSDLRDVFERFVTTEFTTIDAKGQPITWPVTPYYKSGAQTIDITTGVGYPKKADDAERNPYVSLLFSDCTGCGLEKPPMVLVQGTAEVDYENLEANRDRYWEESGEKLPATKKMHPPAFIRKTLDWYYMRIYVKTRPERIYVWADGDPESEPQLLDSHMEEVRSGHDEEPDVTIAGPSGEPARWDSRLDALGTRTYPTAVLSLIAPDGFPFSIRLPVQPDEAAQCVRFNVDALGVPVSSGRACQTAHVHAPEFAWQNNFQVRGDFVERDGEWVFIPHKYVGGFNVPKGRFAFMKENLAKSMQYRKKAKTELARRRASV